MTVKYNDYPFGDVCKTARKLVLDGHDVYQKFSCSNCGQRLTMDIPNHFYETGGCDKCGHITDIKTQGCNYLLHARLKS